MVGVFQAIILLRYQTFFMVLKDALAHLGPYQTLKKVWYNDRGGENTIKNPHTNRFCMVTPHSEQ
jgi:hypothetical protein